MTAALRLVDYETFKKAKSFSPSDWFLIYKKLLDFDFSCSKKCVM